MRAYLSIPLGLLTATALGCTGLSSDIDYPSESIDLDPHIATPEGDEDGGISLSNFRIADDTCKGLDTSVVTEPINQEDLARFLERVSVKATIKKARDNLYWAEFAADDPDERVRLRVAILPDPHAAAQDLHSSLLEHGPGWWGMRRGNLAVLAPKASLSTAIRFAVRTKLACWGMIAYTGVDDVYVVSGGYGEL